MTTQPVDEESVWQYPRPPRLEPTQRHLQVFHAGGLVAETTRSLRVLETSHPPVYYLPPDDVAMEFLRPSRRPGSACEFKGIASYWTLDLSRGMVIPAAGAVVVLDVAWSYENPLPAYAALRGYLAFTPAGSTHAASMASKLPRSQATFAVDGSPTIKRGHSKAAPAR